MGRVKASMTPSWDGMDQSLNRNWETLKKKTLLVVPIGNGVDPMSSALREHLFKKWKFDLLEKPARAVDRLLALEELAARDQEIKL